MAVRLALESVFGLPWNDCSAWRGIRIFRFLLVAGDVRRETGSRGQLAALCVVIALA